MQSKRLSNNVDFKGVYLIKEADVSYPAFGVTSKLWRPGAAYARTGSPLGARHWGRVHWMRVDTSVLKIGSIGVGNGIDGTEVGQLLGAAA